jgi:hypothetical protein
MPKILNVSVSAIDSNPFRQLEKYPYVERKLDALARSYADVGMWEGVIARQQGNRYEIAFGHHRVEAARRSGVDVVPIIVRSLTDEQMLQFMGRENLEDYNADFLCMLEAWEAAVVFVERPGDHRENWQAIDIARLLGWSEPHKGGGVVLNQTAMACNAAYALIRAGHIGREHLRDLAVYSVKEIVQHLQSRVDQIDRMAKQTQRPVEEVEEAKEHLAKAAITTAEKVREGEVATKDLRATADVAAYQFAREANRPSPLFEVFGKNLADRIAKMLKGDASEKKLEEAKFLGDVTLDDDKRIVARLNFELGELGERTAIWRKRITPTDKKVTTLHIAKGES